MAAVQGWEAAAAAATVAFKLGGHLPCMEHMPAVDTAEVLHSRCIN